VIPDLQFLEARDRYLPVKQAAICERMLADPRLSPVQREQLAKLFDMVASRYHFEFHKKLERLKRLYDPFDPDCDMLSPAVDAANLDAQRQELSHAFQQVLVDANYVEMPRRQIVACAEYPSQSKLVLRTDLSRYAQLRVFYRGIQHETQTFRPWFAPWRKQQRIKHVFSRVALFVRLANRSNEPKEPDKKPAVNSATTPSQPSQQTVADTTAERDPVFVKLFKNVVVEDLEMLLPYVRIRMKMFDHLKIGSSVAGGVVTASWKAFTASVISPWLLLLVIVGFLGAAARGFFGFLSSKTKYMEALSSNLYFQNLANNASALAHLTDCAEIEECKEFLLAYYLLYVERDRDYTAVELGHRAEEWLRTEFGLNITLEIADIVRKLAEKDLLVRRPSSDDRPDSPDGVLKVYDIPSSLRRLDAVWDAYYKYNGVCRPEDDHVAETAATHRPHSPASGYHSVGKSRIAAES
jgi:hypothetical protein